jgi:hypothetical protein
VEDGDSSSSHRFALFLSFVVRSFVARGVASDPLRRLLQHRDTISIQKLKR